MTSKQIAAFMCSLFTKTSGNIRLLDPGAGVGSLTAAFVDYACSQDASPREIQATAYEVDALLASYLGDTLEECADRARSQRIKFSSRLKIADFIHDGAEQSYSLFNTRRTFTHVVMNPPYKKISSNSAHRLSLRRAGIETSNLYAGFLALSALLLEDGGELVAITPRSFCNGPYFLPFRKMFLERMTLKHIHVFEERNKAFSEDDVLQENVIFHVVKGADKSRVTISVSSDSEFSDYSSREVDYAQIVNPDDPELFIHMASSTEDDRTAERIKTFHHSLQDLGVSVSTGPVVDFRLKDLLRQEPVTDSVPLVYPGHCRNNFVEWPVDGRKPNAILDTEESNRWLMPNGYYTLVKRFSAKEEKRRISASLHDPKRVEGQLIGFENHLNVFHANKNGLQETLAKGLAVYLNSTLVDAYFRQFNGHTQVNAADLRKLRYPSRKQLVSLGESVNGHFPEQETVDSLIEGLELEATLDKQGRRKNKTGAGNSGASGTSSRAA
ncbi:MAG: Eco57I restriction-modification methylase domain-containing protein [Pseudomonadota bacterium]